MLTFSCRVEGITQQTWQISYFEVWNTFLHSKCASWNFVSVHLILTTSAWLWLHKLLGIFSVIRCTQNCVSPLKAVLILKWMGEKLASFSIFFFLCNLWHISVFFCYLNHVVERLSIKWGKITLRGHWRCSQHIWASACSRSFSHSKRKESGKLSKTFTAQMSQNSPLRRAGVLKNKIGLSCFQSRTSLEPV